jgi:hypothetical protein
MMACGAVGNDQVEIQDALLGEGCWANRTERRRNTINDGPAAAIMVRAAVQNLFPASPVYRNLTAIVANGARGYG